MTFMLVIAGVHLLMVPRAFDDAGYKGILFLIAVVCALFGAMGIQEEAPIRGWVLATLVAAATIAGFVVDGTVGLPGLPADPQTWQEPLGLIALAAEIPMLLVALWAYEAARHRVRRIATT
jgi:hypothetical protein